LDTGSTDSAVEKARDLGIHVETQTFNPWRFDHARNAATLNANATHNIVTGRRFISTQTDLGWVGSIDNMMYFNRALSESEIVLLFNNRNNGFDLSSQVIPI